MGQILVRNVSDDALETLRWRARHRGTSLEQEVRSLIEANAPFTPEERLTASLEVRSMSTGVVPSLTLDEIREGLE
jgi:plasmid stability protein